MSNISRYTAPQLKKSNFDVVAIGSSAGGLAALSTLLSGLQADFPTPILIVQHLERYHVSMMAEILGRHTGLVVAQAFANEALLSGHVYVAPPDYHLLITPDRTISLTQSQLVNFVRPSADMLFESVASIYKERAIAVVLTGTGQDAAAGVIAINKMGGVIIVQDPRTTEFSGMSEAAINTGLVDYVLTLEDIAPTLIRLVQTDPNRDNAHE